MSSDEIVPAIMMADDAIKLWSTAAKCLYSKLEMPQVFQRLRDVGLSAKDIFNLENLADNAVCDEAGIGRASCDTMIGVTNILRTQKNSVVKYMEAWIRILERDQVVPEEKPINAAPNKPMQFVSYKEMKTEMELLFQN